MVRVVGEGEKGKLMVEWVLGTLVWARYVWLRFKTVIRPCIAATIAAVAFITSGTTVSPFPVHRYGYARYLFSPFVFIFDVFSSLWFSLFAWIILACNVYTPPRWSRICVQYGYGFSKEIITRISVYYCLSFVTFFRDHDREHSEYFLRGKTIWYNSTLVFFVVKSVFKKIIECLHWIFLAISFGTLFKTARGAYDCGSTRVFLPWTFNENW